MFRHRQALHWFEFAPIIKRAQKGWCSLRIYAPNTKLNIITILDGEKPRREGCISTIAGSEDDWARDAIICNSSWDNGQIPIHSRKGWVEKDEETWDDIVTMPIRGVLGTLEMLLAGGFIKMTPEVKELFKCVTV